MRHIHIPRLDLELSGVDPDTARQVLDRLPAALSRAMAQGGAGPTRSGTATADALADQVAGQVVARVRARGNPGGD